MSTIKKVLVGALLAVVAFSASADAAMTWSRSLKSGSKGADVKDLQIFLNMCADTKVSMSGAGSAGMETTTFGPATKAAVMKWQMARGVTPASGLFGPLSRAKAAMLQASTDVCAGGVVVVPPVGQTGPVAATLSATTPAAGYIVNNQATAGLLDVTFTGNGVVNSVTLKRSGISDQNTLSNVYLYDGATRLTDGYSFNSAGMITMNNLNLMVNGSKTISVKADASSTASSNSTIAVAVTGFTSGASVNTVNIMGNMMNLATGSSLAGIAFSGINTAPVAFVNAGTTGYTVWRQVVQVNTRALQLKAANFRVTGSAPVDAMTNVRLYVDGVDTGKTSTMSMVNGSNYISFDLMSSPLALNTGSHTMEVRGDIVKGSSYNFTVSLQQASDLMIMDPQVGVNVAVSPFTQSAGGTITIFGGSVTQTPNPAHTALSNTTGGASNTTIGSWKLRGYGEDVKVYTLTVTPSVVNACTSGNIYLTAPCTAGAAFAAGTLQNVTVYFNGSQVGTQTSSWTSGPITVNLGSQMIIPAGIDSILEVKADLRTTGGANYTAGTVSATTSIAQANVEGVSSRTNTNFPVTLSGTGHNLTIQTGLLGLAKNSGYADQNINPNTTGVKIGSFKLQNQSSSEAVRVTTLALALAPVTAPITNYSSLKTSENSNPVQPQLSNTFSVDFTLAPGAVKTVDIFADTSSALVGNIQSTLTVSSIGVSSNVSATSTATVGQLMTIGNGTLSAPTFVTSSPTVSAQYIAAAGGASDAVLARYNFVSTNGVSKITELKFNTTGLAGAITDVKIGSVSAPVIGTQAWLQGLNLDVPQGGSGLNVDVLISYANVGISGIASGSTAGITAFEVKSTSGGVTTITPLAVASNTMTLTGSRPTVALGLPNGAAGSSTSGLSAGTKYVADVKITADAKGDIKVNTLNLTFTGNAAGTTSNGAGIVVKNASGSIIATAVVTGTAGQNATASITFTGGFVVSASQTETFKIELPVTAVAGASSSIATGLGLASTFTWTDVAGNGTAVQTGTLILNYPTSSVSMTN
jgi:Putative peptidoglycan binding domain